MQILKTDFVAGAQAATGVAVIIDVFRAFSLACYCLDKEPAGYYPVGEAGQALALKQRFEDAVLIGEREGKPLPGFDYGNSPHQLENVDLQGCSIVQTTHAGTQGLVQANQADVVLTGALVNARATARLIKYLNPDTVTLVRMGWKAESRTDEDDLCADYLEALLLDRPFDTQTIRPQLLASPCTARFRDPDQPWNPHQDIDLCLAVDRFDFALRAGLSPGGLLELRPV